MDCGPDGQNDSLITPAQEQTALRTHNLLVASRLLFIFSHGALVVTSSITLGWERATNVDASWWAIFTPVWLGNTACIAMIIASWFASCPYIQLCLGERQARFGPANPSILTEIIPEIVMGILGFVVVVLAFIGEMMLCAYLNRWRHGDPPPDALVPSAVVLMIVAFFACLHGICVTTHGELLIILGCGLLATFVLGLCVPGGPMGQKSWVVVLPSFFSCAGLLIAAIRRSRECRLVLSREERFLRAAEQLTLLVVLVAILALAVAFAQEDLPERSLVAVLPPVAGTVAGAGVCSVAALRTRMAILENRQVPVRERLLVSKALAADGQDLAVLHDRSASLL